MAYCAKKKISRRSFLKKSAAATVAITMGLKAQSAFAADKRRASAGIGKKVIVIGIDGMDPVLSERMMDAGMLPNFEKLRKLGGYRRLGTSNPPQSPVAWSNFINGAGPGSHGIFDFLHRDVKKNCQLHNAIAWAEPGEGCIGIGNHIVQLEFWPFNHKPSRIVSGRKGTPFWEFLDEAKIPSQVYLMPSNFPPTASKYGNHQSLSGMGTPDIMGSWGTYQYFTEEKPVHVTTSAESKISGLVFENNTALAELYGPKDHFLKTPEDTIIKFLIHRDRAADAAMIEIQDKKILLKEGQWSDWLKLDFEMSTLVPMRSKHVSGICRFYLQKVRPYFQLYASPINIDPSDPVMQISEPANFSQEISKKRGLFYTIGFPERFNARDSSVFNDEEFAEQAGMVLEERLKLLEYSMENYEDGLLFFYFSSTDLQAHIFWWDSSDKHPVRSRSEAIKYHYHIKKLYQRMDAVMGDILNRYGGKATIFAISDHGFSCFKRSFNLNVWLRDNGYIDPPYCTTLYPDKSQKSSLAETGVNWSKSRAYGVGFNSLYLNLKGREPNGTVEPSEREQLLAELITKLQAVQDENGKQVIRQVYRSDQIYSGPEAKFAPDLIIGYYAGYRVAQTSVTGLLRGNILSDNTAAWSADHCFDPREVPGILFCNKPLDAAAPTLIDLAPTILSEFDLPKPAIMTGKNLFAI